jgi:hypothetical protein
MKIKIYKQKQRKHEDSNGRAIWALGFLLSMQHILQNY